MLFVVWFFDDFAVERDNCVTGDDQLCVRIGEQIISNLQEFLENFKFLPTSSQMCRAFCSAVART
jgi:hypothetical protein